MKQYNYPVRYFSGTGVQIYPQEVFNRKIKFFDELTKFDAPIVGETGIDGMLIDFNYGLRLQIPEGNWHVRIVDLESDYVFVDDDLSAVVLISIEKFYIEWEIALWLDGEPIFYHQFDPRGQKVHFNFPKATLGDNITMLTYVEAFRRQFNGEVSCSIPEVFNDIIKSVPLLRVGHAILRCIETPSKMERINQLAYADFFIVLGSGLSWLAWTVGVLEKNIRAASH